MLQNSVLKVVIKESTSQNFKSAENFVFYLLLAFSRFFYVF